MYRKSILFLIVFLLLKISLFAQKPELFLLNKYTKDINITGWYMSEKLDGVRAYWDGEKLISRSGKVFSTPVFFIKDFPKRELDGELWSKRGDFSNIVSIVNQKKPHNGWNKLTFNVFEVPHAEGNLVTRLATVQESQYIKLVQQKKIKTDTALFKFLKDIENKKGEGVVLRKGSLSYYAGRTNNALKLKSYVDEECKVIDINEGQGKNSERMGSLLCQMNNGKRIKIGTGFSQKERIDPPKIGTFITFKYYGLTSKGNPRFPVFMRIRSMTDELSR